MTIKFDGKVAIVTGAGGGLGRSHALELARRGAKVIVNDFGGARDGTGGSSTAAESVVAEIKAAGGEAIADGADVSNFEAVSQMITSAVNAWGRIDILVNNAGILRDKTFAKMDLADFQKVMDVHLMVAVHCSKAVWPIMQEQAYGRIVVTTSSSGLYGNFGQSNYGAAKLALVGLMNTLHLEGAKYNIRVNALAPVAATRMTADLMPEEMLAHLAPEAVSQGLMFLVSDEAPSRQILCAGAGGYAVAKIFETKGAHFVGDAVSAESVCDHWAEISDLDGQKEPMSGGDQTMKFLTMATKASS